MPLFSNVFIIWITLYAKKFDLLKSEGGATTISVHTICLFSTVVSVPKLLWQH
jgi:hypothetical protein